MKTACLILCVLASICGSCVKPSEPADWSFNLGLQVSFQQDGDQEESAKND